MIRRALASELIASGLSGRPAPVAGSTRRIAPSRETGIAGRAQILASQRAALRSRRAQHGADRAGGIPARVERAPVLAPVGEVEARSVAATCIERPVRPERQRPGRVARILLAPVLDQHLLAPHHHVPGRLEAGETTAHDDSRQQSAPAASGTDRTAPRASPSAARAPSFPARGRTCRERRRTAGWGMPGRARARAGPDPRSCRRSCSDRRKASASCRRGCRTP